MPKLNIELDDILHQLSMAFFDDHIKDKLERYRGKNYCDFISDLLSIILIDIMNQNDDNSTHVDLVLPKTTMDKITKVASEYEMTNENLVSTILLSGLDVLAFK